MLGFASRQQTGVRITQQQGHSIAELPLGFDLQSIVVRPARRLHGLADVVVLREGPQRLVYRSAECRPWERNVVLRRDRRRQRLVKESSQREILGVQLIQV